MFRPYQQSQSYLLPPNLEDFVGEGHPAHLINDLVDQMDLRVLEARYGPLGQPAYHPRLMLKVILYGFTEGIFSSRKLQRACQSFPGRMAFKYLAGMETPAFRTFIEFRQRHREDMQAVFVQTVKLARALGLARLGAVALDGTKVTANTSKHKAMSHGRMGVEEAKLKAEVAELLVKAEAVDAQEEQAYGEDADGYQVAEELARREGRLQKIAEARAALEERERREHPGEPIDPKRQISFADPDARCFAKPGEGTRYVYNLQAAVDMDSQIIVANHREDSVSDAHAAGPILEQMDRLLGQAPGVLVADAGYGNQETRDRCQERGVTPVCATRREGQEGRESSKLDRCAYDAARDWFICPHGAVFRFVREHPTSGTRTYRTGETVPCTCGHAETADGREVLTVGQSHLAQRELQRILAEPGHRALYRRRKTTVEPVFGQIKEGMGFRRLLYRGKQQVDSEWNLVCAAFNVKKMAALLRAKGCPANPDPAPTDDGPNGPFSSRRPPTFLFFSGLLALFTPWADPRAASSLAQAA